MSTVLETLGTAYLAVAVAALFVMLVAAGAQSLRDWWRDRPARSNPWFPPEGHPDTDFELPASERDVFAALTARPHWTRTAEVGSR